MCSVLNLPAVFSLENTPDFLTAERVRKPPPPNQMDKKHSCHIKISEKDRIENVVRESNSERFREE